ncbi:MAG: PD40 domain-containing protein [Chloroflexi bacterium]|nr:PD40 domain-containing protein [Chloroflexota bacterium]
MKPAFVARIALLILSLTLAGCVDAVPTPTADPTPTFTPTPSPSPTPTPSIARAVSLTSPAVVGVSSLKGQGAGLILDADGYILTSPRIVSPGTTATVFLADGTAVEGSVIGMDEPLGLAVVKINGGALTAVAWDASVQARPGEEVVLVGREARQGGAETAMRGNVVAVRSDGPAGRSYIETDIKGRPESAGAALVNIHGQVIGIDVGSAIPLEESTIEGVQFTLLAGSIQPLLAGLKDGNVTLIPTPTPTPVPLTATQVLNLTQGMLAQVKGLRVTMDGRIAAGDIAYPILIEGFWEQPDNAHGVFETFDETTEFLRLGEENYVAYFGDGGFYEDYYNESGGAFIDLLKSLLGPLNTEVISALERQPDETVDGNPFYHLTYRLNMEDFLYTLLQGSLGGAEVRAAADLLVDQDTLLPYRYSITCKSCLEGIADLVVTFTLASLNEPLVIPSPLDAPSLLMARLLQQFTSALPIATGEEIPATLQRGGKHFYAVELEGGTAYTVQVSLGTLADSVLTLWDQSLTEVAYNDDCFGGGSCVTYTPPAFAIYYIQVNGYDASDRGTYVLSVVIGAVFTPTPTPTTTPIVATPTPTLVTNGQPAWSPDGSKIAFSTDRDGDYEIYVMDWDGSNPTQLTSNTWSDRQPSWSSDSSRIAFVSRPDGSNSYIYVMKADGADIVKLTSSIANDFEPAWSPDGTKIAFVSTRDGNSEIYVMNVDGSGQTPLTSTPFAEEWPTWSPDGEKLAFRTNRDGNWEIYVMNADGSGQTRLTNNTSDDRGPAWSPDGTLIAFTSQRDGNRELYVMSPDGSNQVRLTFTPAEEFGPTWSPDSKKLAFSTDRDGHQEVYVINADGTNLTRLTIT